MLSTAIYTSLNNNLDFFESRFTVNEHGVVINPEVVYELTMPKCSTPAITICGAETIKGSIKLSIRIFLSSCGLSWPITNHDLPIVRKQTRQETLKNGLDFVINYVSNNCNNERDKKVLKQLVEDYKKLFSDGVYK